HLGQPHAALAGFAGEEVFERRFGVDAIPLAFEEKVHDVRRHVLADSVDRLIHHAQAKFRARNGLAVAAGDLKAVVSALPWQVLRLVGSHLDVELMLYGWRLHVLLAAI